MTQRCGNCRWFAAFVNPATGRKKTTEPGTCHYPLSWPKVWAAYTLDADGRPPFLNSNSVRSWDGWGCKTFEPARAEEAEVKQATLPELKA